MAATLHVKPKSAWKNVKFSALIDSKGDFDGLTSFKELTDYEIAGKPKSSKRKKENKKNARQPKFQDEEKGNASKRKQAENKTGPKNITEKKKKKKVIPSQKIRSVNQVEEPIDKQPSKKKSQSKIKVAEVININEVMEKESNRVEKQIQEKQAISDKKKKNKQEKKFKKLKNVEDKNTSTIDANTKQKNDLAKNSRKRKQNSESNKVSPRKKMRVELHSEKPSDKSLKGMEAWQDLHVPQEVLWALRDQGFTEPTPIQRQILPSAIRDQMDIVGAAETGSGKTLAFGIPILHFIMEQHKAEKEKALNAESDVDSGIEAIEESGDITEVNIDNAGNEEGDVDLAQSDEEIEAMEGDDDGGDSDDGDRNNEELEHLFEGGAMEEDEADSLSEEELDDLDGDGIGCVNVINDVDFSCFESQLEAAPIKKAKHIKYKFPRALILEPTRELAVQVKNHLQAAAKYTDIRIAVIVGGLSLEKQRRILNKCPDLIVATPGRLWELFLEGEEFLSEVEKTRLVVVDEADRMIEKGHFEELAKLLERMKKNRDNVNRHTYVFSATLTMVHSGPQRVMKRKKRIFDEKQKLVYLMRKMGLKAKPKVVNITRSIGTVETLTEARINCDKLEKDIYLYYFLKQYPGRTLVFTNSKDCIRRLVSIFTLLQCSPLPLHADMHQRQRLKNLDRFTDNPHGLLMASDVAARGLDIPDVQHVIHYQVPHTVENYVHRSGRTARAYKEGLSVMIIGPEDLKNYRKIINTLNRNEDLPLFPTQQDYVAELRRRVNIVREIETQEYRFNKKNRQNDWFIKAAEEAGLDIEDENLLDEELGDAAEQMKQKKHMKHMKKELAALLRQPVLSRSSYSKYPTKSGKLEALPVKDTAVDALDTVKKLNKGESLTGETTTGELTRSQKRRKSRKKWLKRKQQQGEADTT